MRLSGDGRKREFGKGFGDANDGFELANGDGNGGTSIGLYLGSVDPATDGDEMAGELFGGIR